MNIYLEIFIKAMLAVLVGGLIGSERERHGRAAGMRTHVLVCLGAAMTSMTSLYIFSYLNNAGDMARLPAQVVSGVGFLGAGIIILKNNNMITGLTTAAGVWTTSTIGIAIGFGFYAGAIIVAALYMLTVVLLAKFQKQKKFAKVLYLELDDIYRTNSITEELNSILKDESFSFQVAKPKSEHAGHIGLIISVDKITDEEISAIQDIKNVAYVVEE